MTGGRIPVTVVTGQLGAGKTSYVNALLARCDAPVAVVVNEFGETGIDGDLIGGGPLSAGPEELVELAAGCVCCVVRGDLIATLRDLARRRCDLSGVVIETTGLANPSPVIQTFLADQILAGRYRLDCVVTLVDALHVTVQLETSADAADQIAFADVIVLNKATEAADLPALTSMLANLNPFARIVTATRGRADIGPPFRSHAFDAGRIADRMVSARPDHIDRLGLSSVTLTSDAPLDADRLESWLTMLLAIEGRDILRIKGIVPVAEGRLVVQAVNMMLEGEITGPWPPSEPRHGRLVLIGRRLDKPRLEAGFRACAC